MIHALPGLGADKNMFPGTWKSLPDFLAHDWPENTDVKSLPEVAQRVCEIYNIKDGDILIGASLGGMVACEISRIRELECVYLIGSARNKNEISKLLKILHPLAKVAPIDWLRYSAGKVPSDLTEMFRKADSRFVRNMCAGIFKWDGCDYSQTRLIRIHGKKDMVIPPPPEPDFLIDEGGHLISMTHTEQCVGFIKSQLGIE